MNHGSMPHVALPGRRRVSGPLSVLAYASLLACFLDLAVIRIIWYWAEARFALGFAFTATIATLALWALFAAPRAVVRIPIAGKFALRGLLYATTIVIFVAAGRLAFGVAVGVLALLTNVGMIVLRPR
jgi:hypothetical protein